MNTFTTTGLIHLMGTEVNECNGKHAVAPEANGVSRPQVPPPPPPDPEVLRRCAWEIGERRAAHHFTPAANHVALAMVSPYQGFCHWHLLHSWVEQTAGQRGAAWHHCRMIVRVYDVSYVIFDGLNAHRFQDYTIHALAGHLFFKLPNPGTAQLAEVGFLLRSGEFIPAARSQVTHFASDGVSARGDHAALLVNDRLRVEEIHNLWDQDKILQERSKPRLRERLRIAAFAFDSLVTGQEGMLARFVSELASGLCSQDHEVHVFVPASGQLASDRQIGDVFYHPLEVRPAGSPVDLALNFARAAEKSLQDQPAFDLFHLCEWMTGLAPWIGTRPTVLSLSSMEVTRRNGTPPSSLSLEIQKAERELAHAVDCLLTPDWLRDRAVVEYGIDSDRVHAFPMEARVLTEWECPLDFGQVKAGIGVGPLDRLMLYVGPLEHDAGVDLIVEALPTVLRRTPNLRVAFVGLGGMYGHLEHRARQLGVAHAVRLLGHMHSTPLARILRAAEALVLPSRRRVYQDDAVIDLARRAGRPVVTTHSGPAYLIRHEETGIITYDNPGSMVWAFDRILSDPAHAERMGRTGRGHESGTISWTEAAGRFLELCAQSFPELRKIG